MILELQGYIFFGTSNLLLNRIRARLEGSRMVRPRFVLLDFRRVTGINPSVSLSLDKLTSTATDTRLPSSPPGCSPRCGSLRAAGGGSVSGHPYL